MTSQASSSEQLTGLQNDDGDADGGNAGGGASSFAAALAAQVEDDKTGEDAGNDGDDGKPGESRSKVKPKDLTELAARLGVEVSELYDVAIPVGHGREPLTLGKLKDQGTAFASLEAERLSWTETKVQQEAELTRSRQEFQELLSMIPREQLLNKEVLQRVAARVAARNEALGQQVLVAMPEWRDSAVREAQIAETTTMMQGYGYSPAEVLAIRDPRLMKILRDAARREIQVRKALETVKQVTKKPTPASNGTRGAPRIQQQPARSTRPTSARERFSEALNK